MTARVSSFAALAAAMVVAAIVLLGGGSDYTVHARFDNAGLLVRGGDVQVAGRRVGRIGKIELTDDGQADIELNITDGDVAPLHAGTRAAIRTVGQAGVANRFVDLQPGSTRTSELDDGATLPSSQTDGIVNIDALLNTFDPATRRNLQELMGRSNEVFAGSGSTYFNSMLGKLSPAMGEVRATTAELAADGAQLDRLITTAEQSATAVAERRPDLLSALDSSARWLSVLAAERESVASALRDAPAALREGSVTLDRAAETVTELRPVLRDIPAAAPSLRAALGQIGQTVPKAGPVVANLADRLPGVRRVLDNLAPLDPPLRELLGSTTEAVKAAQPILPPLRAYTPDLLLGVVNGLAGVAVGNYNAGGHYARLEFVQPPQTLFGGSLANVFSSQPLVPGAFEQKVRQIRRCPGGALPPAPDGSNADLLGEPLCDPSMSMQPDVNRP